MCRFGPRLVIEFDQGEPISGWLKSAGGTATRFAGLLELISLLERAREAEQRATPSTHSPSPAAGGTSGTEARVCET
jgi:hypothetical protein